MPKLWNPQPASVAPVSGYDDDDDDVYLRLQHGKGLHNLVYISYVKHINPASKA
jgi:hypothetical protein